MLALIAGQGDLPRVLADAAGPDLIFEMEGFPSGLPNTRSFRVEKLGSFFKLLKAEGVTDVCFAGAMQRPKLDAKKVDLATMPLVPRIMGALGKGDDALLRVVIGLFEERGMAVRGAHEVVPDLLPPEGCPTRAQPGERDRKDADRAREIQHALGAADVGQACAVAAGQALALEALGGTDHMLAGISGGQRPDGPSGGIFFKAPKPGQDRRIDLPVIGRHTVAGVQAAGLNGLVLEAGGVMVLDIAGVVAACDAAGVFLWIRSP